MQRHQSNSSSSSASQRADPAHLLTTVADKITHALNDTPCEIQHINRLAIQYFAHLAEVNKHNTQLDSVRRMLIKIITEMTKEAETAQLDLNPYPAANSACRVFLFWCIRGSRDSREAEAQRDLEVEVNPLAPFADEAENQVEQDLMQFESGMLCKGPLRQRLKEYKNALARGYDFMKKYEQRIQQGFSARSGRKLE